MGQTCTKDTSPRSNRHQFTQHNIQVATPRRILGVVADIYTYKDLKPIKAWPGVWSREDVIQRGPAEFVEF